MKQIQVVIRTPKDYSGVSRQKMITAGLERIEQDFEYDDTFEGQQFGFCGTRYCFKDGKVITDPAKFRKLVYGNSLK